MISQTCPWGQFPLHLGVSKNESAHGTGFVVVVVVEVELDVVVVVDIVVVVEQGLLSQESYPDLYS